jgi:hypothetical protein
MNIVLRSTSILKSFGAIWFVSFHSLKVLEQFGPFNFDPEQFLRNFGLLHLQSSDNLKDASLQS